MKNRELLNKLNALKETHIEMIDVSRSVNYTCGLASNYMENTIADLLKTSQKALDGLVSIETNSTKWNIILPM